MQTTQTSQKIQAFRARLESSGTSIADYCRAHGLDYESVHAVLRGRAKGKRGKVHQAMVAIGIKPAAKAKPQAH